MTKNYSDDERKDAIRGLRKILRGKDVIYTATEYTRGSTDYVKLFTVYKGEIYNITWLAARAFDKKMNYNHNALAYGGYGYSKSFQAVYDLGRVLYPKGYAHTAKNCHSNDHSNGDNRHWHPDGGYRFDQKGI